MRLLVLGGTQFVGRAIVEAALERGWEVTLFNRGRSNPSLFGDRVARLVGDRTAGDLGALAGGAFDAVVDVSAYHPNAVAGVFHAMGDATPYYVLISTISVLHVAGEGDERYRAYGRDKLAAEQKLLELAPGRCLILRPTQITGPHDNTHRFRSEGGEVFSLHSGARLTPPEHHDAACFGRHVIACVEARRTGIEDTWRLAERHHPPAT